MQTSKRVMPHVYKAVCALFNDQGLGVPSRYVLPTRNADGQRVDWWRVDAYLATLDVPDPQNESFTKLESFCVGDADDDIARIAAENPRRSAAAHLAVEALFEEIGA